MAEWTNMPIELTDDGTMDTVLRCSECGEEMRYNYDPCRDSPEDGDPDSSAADYDAFVEECIEDATADHECASEDEEPDEPQEDDLTTSDHRVFYQNGKPAFWASSGPRGRWYYRIGTNSPAMLLGSFGEDHVAAVRAYMDRVQFWPNAWFISDHGNAHLMDLNTEAK